VNKIIYDNYYHQNRNYGCRFNEIIYKGFRTIVIENEKIRVSILLDKGTDIIEFLYKPVDIDFMWRSPLEVNAFNKNQITKQLDTGGFFDSYEGGWQECLPNINLPSNYKGSCVGLHGEITLLPWCYEVVIDSVYEVKLKFFVRMRRVPFFVTKYITLKSNSSILEFEEIIKNEGDEEFKFMWGFHPVVGKPFLDENCFIDIPEGSIGHTYEIDYSGNCILPLDKDFNWPYVEDLKKNKVDLSKIFTPEIKTAFNIYIKNLKEGWYGITNIKKGLGFGLKWDVNIFKYLMFWFVYRGFYNFPFYGRTYNIGIEPWSAIPGDLDEVIKLKRELVLLPQKEMKTKYYAIVFESKNRINGFTKDNKIIPRNN
jgi:hypothetical protein